MTNNLQLFSVLVLSKSNNLESFLSPLFKNVYFLNDGVDAISFLKDNPFFNIILIDDDLFSLKGFDVLEKIRVFNKNIKIILFNEKYEIHLLNNCLKFKADFVIKPFSNDFLLMKLLNLSDELIIQYENESKLEELILLKERSNINYAILKIDQNLKNIFYNDKFLEMFPNYKNISDLFFSENDFFDFSGILIDVYKENFWKGNLVLKDLNKAIKVDVDIILRKNNLSKNLTYILIFKNISSDSCKKVKQHFLKKNSEIFMNSKIIKSELEIKIKKLEQDFKFYYNKNEILLLKEDINKLKNDKLKKEKELFLLKKELKEKDIYIESLKSDNLEYKHQFLLINSDRYIDSLLSKIDFWRNKFTEIENKRGIL